MSAPTEPTNAVDFAVRRDDWRQCRFTSTPLPATLRDGQVFAWAGATQIVFGITMLLASTRYRSLAPLVLLLVVLERGLHALNA